MIDPFALPQTFLLPRETTHAEIDAALRDIGFRRVSTGIGTLPLIDGEPECAAWQWPGGRPSVAYSFNPVVRLRLLEVGTVPPRSRAVIQAALRPLHPSEVRDALYCDDERRKLWGIWAALATERLDLVHDLGQVVETARNSIRDEAEAALHKLGDLADLRMETLAGARLIAGTAMDVIATLEDPETVRGLLPDLAACEILFAPEIAAEVAARVAAKRWPSRGVTLVPERQSDVDAAPAGLFRWPNEVSDGFPLGYRTIAGWMEPSAIWIAWAGQDADGGLLRMDGLVFAEGRWLFFPKPFRIVEPLLPALPEPADD